MTADLLCRNLLAWSAQMAILIAAGGVLCLAFRLQPPRVKLMFWHFLLAASLLLPLIPVRGPGEAAAPAHVSVSTGSMVPMMPETGGPVRFSRTGIALGVAAAGVMLRFGWLALGLYRLRRYRYGSLYLSGPSEPVRTTIRELGVSAGFYLSHDVSGPVTFGFRNPTVLLPASFPALSVEAQRAIVCHELLHLRRNDWLFTLAEEAIRGLFWFHPAIWWLLAQIQLTREQAVDRAVIEHTQDRARYVDALLAVASSRFHADVAPAPLFLRKRHLAARMAAIVKGVHVSKRRLIASLAGIGALLPAAAAIALWQFPLVAAPEASPADSPGVEVPSTVPFILLHRAPVSYPDAALAAGVFGDVVASVTVNDKGEVTDAHVVSGPLPLRKAVLDSVLQWHFDPHVTYPPDRSFEIAVRFRADAAQNAAASDAMMARFLPATFAVKGIDVSYVPEALRDKAAALLNGHDGETISRDRFLELGRELQQVDSHLALTYSTEKETVTLRPMLLDAPLLRGSFPPASGDAKRIRVGGNVQAANLIEKHVPVYPVEAKQQRIQGIVHLIALIGSDGRVKDVQLLSGHPLLVTSAIDSVKQWVYRPTLLNGDPVEVITQIDVNYTLVE
jgi:TonB family protein